MFIVRPAAEIDPDSPISSSKRTLPGPIAPRLERSMRIRSFATVRRVAPRMVTLASVFAAALVLGDAGRAEAEDLVLFAAGSLREALTQVARDFQTGAGVSVRTEFGPSGVMRERIEKGERVDVFASADMGHPVRLEQQGRATRVAMFARNT